MEASATTTRRRSRLRRIERLLRRLLAHAEVGPVRYLSVEAAAVRSSLSTKSIRRLLARGRLTALRPVAGRIVIDAMELDTLMATAKRAPRIGRGRR